MQIKFSFKKFIAFWKGLAEATSVLIIVLMLVLAPICIALFLSDALSHAWLFLIIVFGYMLEASIYYALFGLD